MGGGWRVGLIPAFLVTRHTALVTLTDERTRLGGRRFRFDVPTQRFRQWNSLGRLCRDRRLASGRLPRVQLRIVVRNELLVHQLLTLPCYRGRSARRRWPEGGRSSV